MAKTIKCITTTEGILIEHGLKFSPEAAKRYFGGLVGKTIKNVILQKSEDSYNPQIVLEFEQGGAASILMDAEGNGPGFIEYHEE